MMYFIFLSTTFNHHHGVYEILRKKHAGRFTALQMNCENEKTKRKKEQKKTYKAKEKY